ncbi:MAG: hypothetical protein H6617_02485 [Bdellovibrionaceae bacterium]|nr:hypothetical protein [Bdellovibrionales bacterium]MCB9253530.1 hypothetical protein [Pseudobdellovibrionaceae bacterium]
MALRSAFIFVAFFLSNFGFGGTETVETTINTCVMVFRVEANNVQPLNFRPAHFEIGFNIRVNQSDRPGEPFDYEDRVVSTGNAYEPTVSLYWDGELVLARWWTGLPGEYAQFPMEFVEGSWTTLAAGGPVELLAPEDVTQRIEAELSEWAPQGASPLNYFNLHFVEQEQDGTRMTIARETPFRPHFILRDGFLSAEGMLSNFVITLETP